MFLQVGSFVYFHDLQIGKTLMEAMQKDWILLHNSDLEIWQFPKIVVPQNGWFIWEIPIKMG